MKIAFFGTPQLSVWVLEELAKQDIYPDLLVTTPDSPQGRKLELKPTPVKKWGEENNINVLETKSLRDKSAFPKLTEESWDLFIVAAYNIILPKWVLDLPKNGTLNVHPSLLPKLRGPSPVRSAILLNEQNAVGTTIIKLDQEIDHGPIIESLPIKTAEWPIKGKKLDEILFRKGGELLSKIIEPWVLNKLKPSEQEHSNATFSKKFKKEDGELNLQDEPYKNYLKFCAFDGWPRTFFFKNGKRFVITEATFENSKFEIKKVIPEGGKEIPYSENL